MDSDEEIVSKTPPVKKHVMSILTNMFNSLQKSDDFDLELVDSKEKNSWMTHVNKLVDRCEDCGDDVKLSSYIDSSGSGLVHVRVYFKHFIYQFTLQIL